MTSTHPRMSGSPEEEALLEHLERHVETEQEVLDSYAELAARAPEHVRYLVGLIIDDEERHHRILQEMANRVLGDIEFRDIGPSVPYLHSANLDRDGLMANTARALELERDDLRGLKTLGRILRQQRLGGLMPLLVRIMELDTRKHVAILEFIAKTTRRPGDPSAVSPSRRQRQGRRSGSRWRQGSQSPRRFLMGSSARDEGPRREGRMALGRRASRPYRRG